MTSGNPKIYSGCGSNQDPRPPEMVQRDLDALEEVIGSHQFGRYRVKHVPTQTITEEQVTAMEALEMIGAQSLSARIFVAVWTLDHLQRLLDHWNRMSPGVWIYEAINLDPGPVTRQPAVHVLTA
jgi:hypothetical protein